MPFLTFNSVDCRTCEQAAFELIWDISTRCVAGTVSFCKVLRTASKKAVQIKFSIRIRTLIYMFLWCRMASLLSSSWSRRCVADWISTAHFAERRGCVFRERIAFFRCSSPKDGETWCFANGFWRSSVLIFFGAGTRAACLEDFCDCAAVLYSLLKQ